MKRNWLVSATLAAALLAVTGGPVLAAEKPAPVTIAVPIRAELVTLEGLVVQTANDYEIDGWTLAGDTALFASLKGQQVWVLGTSDETTGARRFRVERIEQQVAMNRALPTRVTISGKGVAFDQAPFMQKGTLMLPLRALVEAAGGTIEWQPETWSAHVLLADRSADFIVGEAKAEMYLNNARYFGRNFLQMDQGVILQNGRMFVSADAVSSVLGMSEEVNGDEASLALRFPGFVAAPAPVETGYRFEWFGDRLQIAGKANVPDLHFELLLDGKVIGQADAMIKDGEYIANIIPEGGRPQTGALELSIQDPRTGAELARESVK